MAKSPHSSNTNLIFSNFSLCFLFSDTTEERLALNECKRLLQELNQKHCQIFSPTKNRYHQNPDRPNKSYLDQLYSVIKLLTVALQHPDIVQIEYNRKGKCSGTKIEKKFDVPIGFPQTSGYYLLPMCSVIKFELDPANQSQYYCQG